jgi:gliding motility-associated-like protein
MTGAIASRKTNNMLRYLLLLLTCACTLPEVHAQNENSMWAFGYHNGLNFNTSPPTFYQTNMVSIEGCASVANGAGALLFYSNGNDVWNATGAVMPNGSGILGNGPGFSAGALGSCAQGVAIVKSISNNNQYYLFTLDAAEQVSGGSNAPGYLRYSVVDMSLNSGAGDVIAGQKNIVLDTFMSEKMTVTKGAGCYYWLIAHRNNSATYRAFKIDVTGINPGVSSTGTWTGDMGAGQLKVSPDGTRIANCNSLTGSGIELGTFNNATGMVSNTGIFDVNMFNKLGTCFSPDNTKLYITSFGDLAQYDISSYPNFTTIAASKVVIHSGIQYAQLKNGPDGKIYCAYYQNHPYIGVINNPNNAGVTCNLNTMALPQPAWSAFTSIPGNPYGHTLGNDIVVGVSADTAYNDTKDTLVCFETSLDVSAPSGFDEYLWNDGNTNANRTLTADGDYWVYSFQNCNITIDTFKVHFVDLSVNLGPDTAICENMQITLDAGNPGATYKWQDGSTNQTLEVNNEGTYMVKVNEEGCIKSDTIIVDEFVPSLNIPQHDTNICDDETIKLNVEAAPISNYLWSTGSTEDKIVVSKPGVYSVTGTNACGTFRDSVKIEMQDCTCKTFIPNAFSPNDDGLNDVFKVSTICTSSDFSISIYNRMGQRVFQSTSQDKGWDGTYNDQPCDVSTYFYYLKFTGPRGDAFVKKGDLILLR